MKRDILKRLALKKLQTLLKRWPDITVEDVNMGFQNEISSNIFGTRIAEKYVLSV